MPVSIRKVSPREAQARALLQQSRALMDRLFGPDDNLGLDVEALLAPGISVFAAETEGRMLGCIALRRMAGYGEIKSLYVQDAARGLGVGRRLLTHLEDVARGEGLETLRLETGAALTEAGHLYRTAGFTPRGPFGDYLDTAASLFYEKHLDQLR
jgi:putative acetyltransferase